ncbi:hybrid sensor histidine kinase/response regulator [Pandoraea fibrosis]|uniref:histidine kinase n=1 Tax=Pandoraea fibrosis TaxID=1891094 RepID=A0A5E4RRX5_9BURK|nr:hybrid sensor histidine kinase/response regulator [Pandoraea fibrosis]VVD65783.1 PAS/PAC sensor hybrid histidine kinase [Pandoraea fibrosis]
MNLDKSNFRRGGADAGRYEPDGLLAATSPGLQGDVRGGREDVSIFRMALVHELRAPLQVLQGHLDALCCGAGVDGSAGAIRGEPGAMAPRERFGAMRRMLEVVAGAVDDVLQLGQGEVTHLPLREAVFEVRACLDEEVDSFAGVAHAKGLLLACHIADDVPVMLWGDATRLRQMLRTLLDNALKYTVCGGVTVRASWGAVNPPDSRPTALRATMASGELTIVVNDTGPGVPAGMENAVFAAFARADRSVPGTGLGLWIAQQWAQRMGGSLCVVPSTSGARFELAVPLALPSVMPAPGETRQDVPCPAVADMTVARIDVRAGLRALVVDDHVMNRAILADQLMSLGCVVERAEDLTEALLQWISRDVDVVLTDVQLDGASGLTLAKTLHALAPVLGRRAPVVFAVTGSVVEARAAREAGIDDVLTKPVSRQRLAQTLAVRWPSPGLDGAEGDAEGEGAKEVVSGPTDARPKVTRPSLLDDPYARRLMREEMAKDLARFRRLIATRRPADLDAAEALLHRMRGACRMFGDPALTARCDRLSEKLADCRSAPGDYR